MAPPHSIHLSVCLLTDVTVVSSRESHINDKVTKFLTHCQSAAIDSIVSTMPMTNAAMVRRGIELLPEEDVKISPPKLLLVLRAVANSRARVLLPFSMGEK